MDDSELTYKPPQEKLINDFLKAYCKIDCFDPNSYNDDNESLKGYKPKSFIYASDLYDKCSEWLKSKTSEKQPLPQTVFNDKVMAHFAGKAKESGKLTADDVCDARVIYKKYKTTKGTKQPPAKAGGLGGLKSTPAT